MDVHDQRRTCAVSEEQVVAMPVAGAITLVKLGVGRFAIDGRGSLPTCKDRTYLRDAPAIVVFDLMVASCHARLSVSPPMRTEQAAFSAVSVRCQVLQSSKP